MLPDITDKLVGRVGLSVVLVKVWIHETAGVRSRHVVMNDKRTRSHLSFLIVGNSPLLTIAQTKSGTRVPGASLKSSSISSRGRWWRSTKVRSVWKANWRKSWRGRKVKIVWRDAMPRRPVEKLKKSVYPSLVRPPLVGLENCCSRRGRCALSLVRNYIRDPLEGLERRERILTYHALALLELWYFP